MNPTYFPALFMHIISYSLTYCVITTIPTSPCPEVVRYELNYNQIYGVIQAKPLKASRHLKLQVMFSLGARLPLISSVGSIELYEDQKTSLKYMEKGWPVRYKVNFPMPSPLPEVLSVQMNGNKICQGSPADVEYVTILELEHTLKSENYTKFNVRPRDNTYYKDRVFFIDDLTPEIFNRGGFRDVAVHFDAVAQLPEESADSSIVFEPRPRIVDSTRLTNVCGQRASAESNPLIVNGDSTEKGDWPWLAAVFVKKPRGLDFICAATLISSRLLVTAAHCVYRNYRREDPTKVLVKMGVYNLQDWTDTDAISRNIKEIKTPISLNERTALTHDIAILVVAQVIPFTNFIRPVCLWESDKSQSKIVNKVGSVIGWGRDETGMVTTPEPRLIEVNIVSTEKCRASRMEFFRLTSQRTFCAGSRNGKGPCNGDSGGGLYVLDGSKWTIRGIISNSLTDPITNSCNLYEYIVYSDLAVYVDWIKAL